jgi:hypothetical protein
MQYIPTRSPLVVLPETVALVFVEAINAFAGLRVTRSGVEGEEVPRWM